MQVIFLAVLGACFGSAINYGIYSWTWFLKRSISPWQSPSPAAPLRGWLDRVPIWGWLRLRREQAIHGQWFWVRPLALELVWLIGLPWFYFWQLEGGLTCGRIVPEPPGWPTQVEIWFWSHAVLLALMFIATFIDFDERTIPDSVTVSGTLFALVLAALFPFSRLPEVASNLAGKLIEPISFANGARETLLGIEPEIFVQGVTWHQSSIGTWIAIIIFWVWIIALLPKRCTLRFGWIKGIWIMIFSCLRPKRKTACSIRQVERSPYLETVLLAMLGVIGTAAILLSKWLLPAANWDSLFQAIFGLGFGGLMIWGIRIVGQFALQREAMGFGDVTLMAMIGAFLGWQVTLLTLPIAVVLALVATVGLFIFTRDSQLAFGPYLCLGCVAVLFYWCRLWPATGFYFSMGEWLFAILGFMLALMLGMLSGLQLIKRLLGTA
jgi:prepilin signal peptidase PulO-like enzyme (type II secretory pathway)